MAGPRFAVGKTCAQRGAKRQDCNCHFFPGHGSGLKAAVCDNIIQQAENGIDHDQSLDSPRPDDLSTLADFVPGWNG
jgi:hypothetical protein